VKLPAAITLALVLVYFAIGWFGYDWGVGHVTAGTGVPIIVDSVQEAFLHRWITSLSCAAVGISIGLGAWMCTRGIKKHYIRFVSALFIVSILASGIWLQYLTQRLTALPRDLVIATGLPITSLPISEVKTYEIGLFASGILWVIAIFIFAFNRSGPKDGSKSL
jgi:hypothetical protein